MDNPSFQCAPLLVCFLYPLLFVLLSLCGLAQVTYGRASTERNRRGEKGCGGEGGSKLKKRGEKNIQRKTRVCKSTRTKRKVPLKHAQK